MPDIAPDLARTYVEALCAVVPNRTVGSPGNRRATDFFAETVGKFGSEVIQDDFACIDWTTTGASLTVDGDTFDVETETYSQGCDVTAQMVVATTADELRAVECQGKVLLLKGPITSEQLMPKSFVFYNPDHHKEIIALLEQKQPAAIVAATARNPEMVGAVYPFPLIEDGDVDIASVCMKDVDGERLAAFAGQTVHVVSEASRTPSTGTNVIARFGDCRAKKLVVCAHIDAKQGTPGALDDAAGTATLLLLAQLLQDYESTPGVEVVALNGEDYYSVPGQMQYLAKNQDSLDTIALAINLDDVGQKGGDTCFSLYECSDQCAGIIRPTLSAREGIREGEQWMQGDHMIFVMNGRPAVAVTSEHMARFMADAAHTPRDVPELVDYGKLVTLALGLRDVVDAMG